MTTFLTITDSRTCAAGVDVTGTTGVGRGGAVRTVAAGQAATTCHTAGGGAAGGCDTEAGGPI